MAPVLPASGGPVSDENKAYIANKLRGFLKTNKKNINTKEIFDWIDVRRLY